MTKQINKQIKRKKLAGLMIGIVGVSGLAQAQTTPAQPDAGSVIRSNQLTSPAQAAPTGQSILPVPLADETLLKDTTPVAIQRFVFSGNTVYDSAALSALLADTTKGSNPLNVYAQALRRITELYRSNGYVLARAYLPAQKIENNTLHIQVLEGQLAAVNLRNSGHLKDSFLQAALQGIPVGAPARQDQIDQALLLLTDLPGANMKAQLAPGNASGQTQLDVVMNTAPLVSGRIELDNYGSVYTGRTRVGGEVNFNAPFGLGEQISLRLLASDEKLSYGRLGITMPLGSTALIGGLSVSRTSYTLGNTFASLDATGTADSLEANLRYAVIRSPERSLFVQGGQEHKKLHDKVNATATQIDKNADVTYVGLQFYNRDQWMTGGVTTVGVRGNFGRLGLDSATLAVDSAGAKTNGHYSVYRIDLSRQQRLTNTWTLDAKLNTQFASKNLDSSEKMVLGGATGVRAYPSGEGSGDEGWLTNFELAYAMSPMLTPSVFYDHGRTRTNKNEFLPGGNDRRLAGFGLGLRGSWSKLDWRASVAWRSNTASVSEPDKSPRAWFQVSSAF
jgi:hemolysin activation/secretion protein